MTSIIILRVKSGQTIICFLENETEEILHVSDAMTMAHIETQQYHGLGFIPIIPFDIDSTIVPFQKTEIMFRITANILLQEMYLDKVEENVKMNITFMQQYYNKKKDTEKLLN